RPTDHRSNRFRPSLRGLYRSNTMSNETQMRGLTFSGDGLEILKRIFEVKQALGTTSVAKNARNNYAGNTYADLSAVLNLVEPKLGEAGMISITYSNVDEVMA